MSQKNFAGVAVYPVRIPRIGTTLVGVWLGRDITPDQHQKIFNINNTHDIPGHIGVRTDVSGTMVMYAGWVGNWKRARIVAAFLSRVVAEVTGAQSETRPLSDYRSVSRALAPTVL